MNAEVESPSSDASVSRAGAIAGRILPATPAFSQFTACHVSTSSETSQHTRRPSAGEPRAMTKAEYPVNVRSDFFRPPAPRRPGEDRQKRALPRVTPAARQQNKRASRQSAPAGLGRGASVAATRSRSTCTGSAGRYRRRQVQVRGRRRPTDAIGDASTGVVRSRSSNTRPLRWSTSPAARTTRRGARWRGQGRGVDRPHGRGGSPGDVDTTGS